MADKRHAVVVLTESLAQAGLDTDAVVETVGGTLVDATEASLTVAVDTKKKATAGVKALVKAGLTKDESVFQVSVEVPSWLDQYREAASAMVEHGG